MTRSVEIPEAAREKAAAELYGAMGGSVSQWLDIHPKVQDHYRELADLMLSAALPYLAPAGDGGLREALAPNCTCDEPIIGGSENRHPNDFRDPECPIHRRKPAAGASTQTPGPAADLIEHAAGIIVESRKQPYTAPGHWAGALWEAGMLVAPGSAAPAVPQPADDLERLHLAASALADLWHVPIDVFWQTREMHLEILRSASVPQPVDREAPTREQIAEALDPAAFTVDGYYKTTGAQRRREYALEKADAVLAVLAGEQEQGREMIKVTDELLAEAMDAYRAEGLREREVNEDSMRAALTAVFAALRD